MTNVSVLRTDAHRTMPDNRPEAMREQARDYLQLAALTEIPDLAREFRAKGHALFARAALVERAIGHPVYFALA